MDEQDPGDSLEQDETDAFLQRSLERELLEQGRAAPLPPWQRYPTIPRYSIGWRMGGGESYLMVFWHWYERLSRDEKLDYFREHAPIPTEWVDWVGMQLEEDEGGGEAEDEGGGEGDGPSFDEMIRRSGERIVHLGLFDVEAWRAYLEGGGEG